LSRKNSAARGWTDGGNIGAAAQGDYAWNGQPAADFKNAFARQIVHLNRIRQNQARRPDLPEHQSRRVANTQGGGYPLQMVELGAIK